MSWNDWILGNELPIRLSFFFGIHRYKGPKQVNQLPGMLALPFVGKITDYAIIRGEWRSSDEK